MAYALSAWDEEDEKVGVPLHKFFLLVVCFWALTMSQDLF